MSFPHHIVEFLDTYDDFSIAPSTNSDLVLKGKFAFKLTYKNENEIEGCYELEIRVPEDFPRSAPKVIEINNQIPRDGRYHINPNGTFCLGTPLRELLVLSQNPSLLEFVDRLLNPYLYAVTSKLRHGKDFVFGELEHGDKGELSDYETLFQVKSPSAVLICLHLLSIRKRVANKKPCPCGCGLRLGSCELHNRLNPFRKIATRADFRKLNADLK